LTEPTDKIEKKILDDSMFANCFAKDPTKQTTHERLAFEYLKKYTSTLDNFCKLPQVGEKSIYLSSDGVFTKEKIKILKYLTSKRSFVVSIEEVVSVVEHNYRK
jgi:hypothetical protein